MQTNQKPWQQMNEWELRQDSDNETKENKIMKLNKNERKDFIDLFVNNTDFFSGVC